ncbi:MULTISPECIES: TetR/AcrR family transcriptional regulator [Actinomadura]|uniref:TetR/AcrR family transcriptional regulator n=1 Tax=Actinomadura yumaensis TaxID=111807 RepID=A0ABW2C9V4_9ACTN|nr:TetR/AcrR family transcriptional regulator [Actinomadura sp. J1-007]MWK33868.1 TetR family transcriptional regulator [Actinomadura sp. J1-007]
MARPRTFEEERAVEAAMRTFWASGYEATSTEELCRATGLGRSSIYNAFKSKHDLFEKALRRYMDEMTGDVVAILESDLPVRERVRAVLRRAVDTEAGDLPGCLVVNAMVELAPRDARVAAMLERDYAVRRDALEAAIESGRRAGEIAADRDAAGLAHFVIATVSGMRVAARAGADRRALEGIAASAMNAL